MMNQPFSIAIVGIMIAASTAPAQQVATAEQMDEVLGELRRIRLLLEERSNPDAPNLSVIEVDVGDSPVLGKADAPITIVEFTDYQCSYCRQFHRQTFHDLKNYYVDSGRVRFFSVDFPLAIHPDAVFAAEAARCAHEQGGFWEMHDSLHLGSESLKLDEVIRRAGEAGLSAPDLRECLNSGRHEQAIRERVEQAQALGIRGTPSFVVGRSNIKGVEGRLGVCRG